MRKLSDHVKLIVLPVHLLGIISLGFLCGFATWWTPLFIWITWLVIGGIGVEVGLHRLFSHHAFKLQSCLIRSIIALLSVLGGQWSPIWWAAMHRGYHHAHTDTEKDIHSPVNGGSWYAFIGWMWRADLTKVSMRYAKDLLGDPLQKLIHLYYSRFYWGLCGLLWLIFGTVGFFTIIVPALFLSMHQENIVNWLCHDERFGYTNFDLDNRARNIWILGLILWGQGYHANHHWKPNRYDFGIMPGEIDICRWIVPALVWIDGKIARLERLMLTCK